MNPVQSVILSISEREQIATILSRRANEIAMYSSEHRQKEFPASVEFALTREIERLRSLASKVDPRKPTEEEE